jgi:hypothetical protein
LDAPLEVYLVRIMLAAGRSISDGEIGRAYCALQELVPLSCEMEGDELVCEVLCSGYTSESAAWNVVARVRELAELRLTAASAGRPDRATPEVVLTGHERHRGDQGGAKPCE